VLGVGSVLMVWTTTNIPNQLGSTWPVLRGSNDSYNDTVLHIRNWAHFIYLLASFEAMIDDKGIKQVGHHCNDPIPVDAEVRDWVVL
jgi:hypothetical protein